MNIVFWSKHAGSGVTSSAVAVGVLLSEMYKRRITLMEEGVERQGALPPGQTAMQRALWQGESGVSLQQLMMGRQHILTVAEEKQYAFLMQMGHHRWGTAASPPKRFVSRSILEILKNGLYYRIQDKPLHQAASTPLLKEQLKATLSILSEQFDDVLIDTGTRKAFNTKYAFDCADLVVVTLPQDAASIERFLQECRPIVDRCVFLLIGMPRVRASKHSTLFQKYGIPTGRVAYIPYSHTYRHAVETGQLVPFLQGVCAARRETEEYELQYYWKKAVRMILRNGQREPAEETEQGGQAELIQR